MATESGLDLVSSSAATSKTDGEGSDELTQHPSGRRFEPDLPHHETRHPTSNEIAKLDSKQTELNEGPCITAIEDPPPSGIVLAQDFAGADAQRWPRFAPEAVAAGYRALLSTQLSANGGVRGALNLYSATPDAFDDQARTLAGLFGAQAALLVYGAHEAHHLQRAVDNRDLIGQAKGILRERFGLDDESAFQMLVKSSQDTNMKLTAVAQWLTDNTGVTPARADRPHLS